MLADEVFALLRTARNPDGGWGARAALPSTTELTSLVALALRRGPEPGDARLHAEAVRWLVSRQRPDGAWPVSDQVGEASWMTALATFALADLELEEEHARAVRGAEWLLEQEGKRPSRLALLLRRLLGGSGEVELDPTLIGWPWRDGTFAWVEPTSHALLALKSLRPYLGGDAGRRIRQGERLILDRMCPGGGWNYGNSRVLGEDLWPYPDTTAWALLALQERSGEPIETSLGALEDMLARERSGLALALGILALSLHGRDVSAYRSALEETFVATAFLGEVRALALAALALTEPGRAFRVPGPEATRGSRP